MALPFFAASLGGVLISVAASVVGRVLAALGLSLVTYYGISQALEWLKSMMMTAMGGLPAEVFQLLAWLKVGTAISIVFSAMFASMLLNGLNSDTFKKWVIN